MGVNLYLIILKKILDGAFVITEYWNEATVAILNIKKQDKTISRWTVQALWLQALKPSTLLPIEQSSRVNLPISNDDNSHKIAQTQNLLHRETKTVRTERKKIKSWK